MAYKCIIATKTAEVLCYTSASDNYSHIALFCSLIEAESMELLTVPELQMKGQL